VYWTETHGGQLLSGPKLIKSFSDYQEKEEEPDNSTRIFLLEVISLI